MAKTIGLIEKEVKKELPKEEKKKTFADPVIDEEKVKAEAVKEEKETFIEPKAEEPIKEEKKK